ncbi:hypothetical protein LEP1GSC081_2937 [Leptospira kirschneri str. H1]|uniref:Uncharacterized protein n=1 Tax=Leptospira kirschneri str. H1 TaxID=1049966 RepID=A0A0E2B5I7_9LEPT|nr:hypothetical protein LEP1GSC081_2937 [Leptospira kirschneri str. H1]
MIELFLKRFFTIETLKNNTISLFKKLECRISFKEVINSVWNSRNL